MYYEFAYHSNEPQMLPLGDEIKIVQEQNNDEFFISNSQELKAQIYAHEINFYLKNSQDDYLQKAKNVSVLYEIRSLIYAASKQEHFYDELGELSCTSFISYNQSSCDYADRRGEVCLKCFHVCPSETIQKDETSKKLFLNHESCINCGACVSVCPTGSMDFASLHRESFLQIASMFKDKIILILSSQIELESLEVSLPKGVVPMVLDTKVLDETHLLTLLQQSGANVVFYTQKPPKALVEISLFINAIYQKRFAQDAIFLASNVDELSNALSKASLIDGSFFSLADPLLQKRQISSKRLNFLVGEEDFGAIKTPVFANYAKISVDEDKCTLCLSCAGACKSGALSIDQKTNSLLFNASLCTGCGYCDASCAESCMDVQRGELKLNPNSFTPQVLASDELFKCVECGKEFATKKSVEKIASMLSVAFSSDELKQRSLYCCADCKAKLMSVRIYEQQKAAMNKAV